MSTMRLIESDVECAVFASPEATGSQMRDGVPKVFYREIRLKYAEEFFEERGL